MKMEVARRDINSGVFARQFIPPRPEVRRVSRCLFGPSNHIDSISFAKQEMLNHKILDMKRWNFDFENEKPLEGKFDWQKFSETNEESRKRPLTDDSQNTEQTPKELRLQPTTQEELIAPVQASSTQQSSPTDLPSTKKTKISDYFHASKRNQQQKRSDPSESHQEPEGLCEGV